MMADALQSWIGRSVGADDIAGAGLFAELAATLDHDTPPWRAGQMPPLGHWLCFHPKARESDLGPDGHPAKGGFMPPVPLPRRMWAGSRITFHAPVSIGDRLQRRSTIADLKERHGRSGALVFVTVRHEIANVLGPVISEEQDIVYREASGPGVAPTVGAPGAPAADWQRQVTPDPVLLFRFSALTFNAHRIHYDRPHAEQEEHYPGLVVQGPLTAMLLMDFFLRAFPAVRVTRFSFRGTRPLFDTAPFTLSGVKREGGAGLMAIDAFGQAAMTAEVEAK
ncbi:MAG: MaoC family dehydratase N-terminal domain-containing protein [Devosia sp.]|nr:MaoC family dehydratase N-terminal domain-containing protein [Devosia sp.]